MSAARRGLLPPLVAVTNPDRQLFLLTGGRHSLNKAIGIDDGAVVKFARTADRDAALLHEHSLLSLLEREHGDLPGVPRPLALQRRCGRVAVVESRVEGRPLAGDVSPALAEQVTDWLIALAGRAASQPRTTWWERLVTEPLNIFEQEYAAVVSAAEVARARDLLARLPDLPLVVEHRDVAPWNLVVAGDGGIGVLDWESSEPEGLPLLDLIYFLEHARVGAPARESCVERYRTALRLPEEVGAPLRALCWIVHARSERRRLETDELADSVFVALLRAELAQSA